MTNMEAYHAKPDRERKKEVRVSLGDLQTVRAQDWRLKDLKAFGYELK